MHRAMRFLLFFSFVCLFAAAVVGEHPASAFPQQSDPRLEEAARLAARQDLPGAEAIYDQILRADPANLAARLARGHVRSWQRKLDLAREDFLAVLQSDPNNLSALNGLGYSFAWAGAYDQAEASFRRALAIAPDLLEAKKGLAFVSLWRGNAEEAIRRFDAVIAQAPNDAEARVALGQAYYAAGRLPEARRSFARAREIDPQRNDARRGWEATRPSRTVAELSLWGGHTWFETGNTGQTGVRFAEVAVLPVRTVRLWFQYDNGLSLDNRTLALSNREIPTYFVGGFVNWRSRYTTRLEGGWRELPGNIRQTLVRTEQVIVLPRSYTFKFGGWAGPRDDDITEWGTHVALGVPLTEHFRIEPTFFYSRSGLPGENQWRLLFGGEYALPQGWSLGAGIAGGRFQRTSGRTDTIWDGNIRLSAPITQYGRAHLMFRRETNGPATAFNVLAFGFSVYIPGR